MDSRYALRSIECAIGYDCRRLDDGRRAAFRHTALHKRARFEFLERRDMISFLGSSLIAYASFSSHHRMKPEAALESIAKDRRSMFMSAFPYIDMSEGKKDRADPDASEYDEYFDELDELEEARKKNEEVRLSD